MSIQVRPAGTSRILAGGVSQIVMYGPLLGGIIQNPSSPEDQGVGGPEPLYVNLVGPAVLAETPTTIALQPGQSLIIQPQITSIWVNAVTTGHKFSAVVFQTPLPPPTPVPTPPFPPSGPTSLLRTLPSYLYQQYNDDDTLIAFVQAYNAIAQAIGPDWFNGTPLPVYTNDAIAGTLLDWVLTGLYGLPRPSLPVGSPTVVGPFNTYVTNGIVFNGHYTVGGEVFSPTTDDTYKRIMTWLFYKGDGHLFTIPWLKRRIIRFLQGVNGTAPSIDQTYDVSVTLSGTNDVTIHAGTYSPTLVEGIASGALELPFQFNYTVTTG